MIAYPLVVQSVREDRGWSRSTAAQRYEIPLDRVCDIESSTGLAPTKWEMAAIVATVGSPSLASYDLLSIDSTQCPALLDASKTLERFVEQCLNAPSSALLVAAAIRAGEPLENVRTNLRSGRNRLVERPIWGGRHGVGPDRLLDYLDRYFPAGNEDVAAELLAAGIACEALHSVLLARGTIHDAFDFGPIGRAAQAVENALTTKDDTYLSGLSDHWSLEVRVAVATNPATPPLVAAGLIADSDVMQEVLPGLKDQERLALLSEIAPPSAWECLVANPAFTGTRLERFVVARCDCIIAGEYSDDAELTLAARDTVANLVYSRWERLTNHALHAISGLRGDPWEELATRAASLLRNRTP